MISGIPRRLPYQYGQKIVNVGNRAYTEYGYFDPYCFRKFLRYGFMTLNMSCDEVLTFDGGGMERFPILLIL